MPKKFKLHRCRIYEWKQLLLTQQRHGRKKIIGGNASLRQWFSFKGSMTQQLRATGKLHLQLNWFKARLKTSSFRYSGKSNSLIWVRHALLQTSTITVEAWVWIPWSARVKEKKWFADAKRPIGDSLFKYKQHRTFIFFKPRGDQRFFRYSHLRSPNNSSVEIIEAVEIHI